MANGFINVDALAEQVSVEQILNHFSVPDDIRHTTNTELRTRCFLQCGKQCETGDRALAIRRDTAAKVWKCHQYGCEMSGNVIALISLAIGGPARPRGKEFLAAAKVLEQIVGGAAPLEATPLSAAPKHTGMKSQEAKVNVPLEDSANERIRAVATLHEKLTVDLAVVPPEVSRYIRKLGFLTQDVARRWGVGYLSRDAGGSKSGGTMRGKFVAAIRNRDGKVVSYMGRDCQYEQKHQAWAAAGREGQEPAKWLFPRLFSRGTEVYAQDRLKDAGIAENLAGFGLPVVEGPIDAIALWENNLPSVALLSNQASQAQVERISELAHQFSDGVVTLLYDLDIFGQKGMDQDLVKFSRHCKVQQGWWSGMDDRLNVNDPAELSAVQVAILRQLVASRGNAG